MDSEDVKEEQRCKRLKVEEAPSKDTQSPSSQTRSEDLFQKKYWEDKDVLQSQIKELYPYYHHENPDRVLTRLASTIHYFPKDFEKRLDYAEQKTLQEVQKSRGSDFRQIVQTLRYCLPLLFGFFCPVENQANWCFCPCSNAGRQWRYVSKLDSSLLPLCDYGPGRSPGRSPGGLIAHLKKKENDPTRSGTIHLVFLTFLKHLFDISYGVRLLLTHEAFYDKNCKEYNTVKTMRDRNVMQAIMRGRKIIQERVQAIEEEKRVKKKLDKMLEKTNGECFEKLRRQSELKAMLHVEKLAPRELPTRSLNLYRAVYVSATRKLKAEHKAFSKEPLKVENLSYDFDLNKVFQKWHKEGLYFFNEEQGPSLLPGLEIEYERALGAKQAVDEGGPTRQFFSTVWENLSTLSIEGGHKLFAERETYLLPNHQVPKQHHETAQAYFKAIGRILAYCILHQEPIPSFVLPGIYQNFLFKGLRPTDQEYSIGELVKHFLNVCEKPDIDKQVADIVKLHLKERSEKKPIDEKSLLFWELEQLASSHLNKSTVRKEIKQTLEKTEQMLAEVDQTLSCAESRVDRILKPMYRQLIQKWHIDLFLLGCSGKLGPKKLPEELFREEVHESYFEVEALKRALGAMREGMTLNGEFDLGDIHALFRRIPSMGVIQLVTARQEFKAEDVIKILTPDYSEDGDSTSSLLNNQKKVLEKKHDGTRQGILAEVIQREAKNKDQPNFLKKFIFFATGYSYLPRDPSFEIIVEFNLDPRETKSNFLVIAHTCVCVIKIPGDAYGGNAEILSEKLLKSMEYTDKGAFDMR